MGVPIIGAGLGATLGTAEEDTWGTFAAPDSFVEFVSETLALDPKNVQSEAINGGLFEQAQRRVRTTRQAAGPVNLELQSRSIGRFLKHMVQCGSPVVGAAGGSSSAYQQVFTPGPSAGLSLSVQVGRPTALGVMEAFSYTGVKVLDWTVDVAVDAISKLQLTLDAKDEDTTEDYAAPSWTDADVFHFAEATLLLGGTAATTGGVCTLTGGTPVASATGASIKGANTLDTARQFVGNGGLKREQLNNGFTKITGELDLEFDDLTTMYEAFSANTQTSLQLTWTGPVIDEANNVNAGLVVLIPAIFFEKGTPDVSGPKILTQKGSFTGLADKLGNPAVQFTYTTLDATPL